MATIRSIQVGLPYQYRDPSSTVKAQAAWTTAFYKLPVSEPVFVSVKGLTGDGHADLKNHGGIDKAVLAYSVAHYPFWCNTLSKPELPFGAFGENLAIEGQTEENVCIGDRYQIGNVLLEVSQPRQPCWKLGRRWNENLLPKMVIQNGYCGWYLRVLEEGEIALEDSVSLVDRPNPLWPIQRANELLYQKTIDSVSLTELFLLPELSASWKESLG